MEQQHFSVSQTAFSFEFPMQMLYEQVKILNNGMDIWLICNFSLNKDLDLDDDTWT